MNKNEDRGEAGFNWPVVIRNPNARASLDYYYGPYGSEEDMRQSVPNELWVPGFTAAVQSEDGAVEEWWVQGEGARADFVKKHEMVIPDGSMRFMGFAGSMTELQSKESPSKGDVWQAAVKNGRYTIYPLYVYDGSDWTPFTQEYKLTIKMPDGTSKTYDGSKQVSVDLSGVATDDKLNELKKTCVTVDQLDDFATWKDGDFTLLGQKISDHSIHYRTPQGNWVDTGISAQQGRLTGGGVGLKLVGTDVGLSRNNIANYYRANPLVLAVRLIYPESLAACRIKELYNPFGLSLNLKGLSRGVYEFTHNLGSSKISKSTLGAHESWGDEWTRKDTAYTYMVMGDACKYDGKKREQLYFSVIQRYSDYFTFRTADDPTVNRFTSCDIIIFDFNTL